MLATVTLLRTPRPGPLSEIQPLLDFIAPRISHLSLAKCTRRGDTQYLQTLDGRHFALQPFRDNQGAGIRLLARLPNARFELPLVKVYLDERNMSFETFFLLLKGLTEAAH